MPAERAGGAPLATPGPVHLVAGAQAAGAVVQAQAAGAQLATVTAGHQEYEGDAGLETTQPVTDLGLHARCEHLFHEFPELRRAHAEHQARVRDAERYYGLRLERAMDALLALLREPGAGPLLQEHRGAAVRALRTLDRQHLRRVASLYAGFRDALDPEVRQALARERERLAEVLRECPLVVLAGGHVAVLLNRLRLLDLRGLLATRTVVAWGAGAMVCTERVLLFHDRGAVGPRYPQLLGPGLGLVGHTVVLPHARERLDLAAGERLGALARRMAPARVVLLDHSAHLPASGARANLRGLLGLSVSGRVIRLRQP